MIKAYKIRLLPTEKQEQLLWKHVHTSRFVWNYCLNYLNERYRNGEKYLNGRKTREVIRALKSTDEYNWLKEISSHTIGNVCLDLDDSFQRLFKGISKHSRFKSRNKCKNSFPVRQDSFYMINNCAVLEKIGKIKYQSDKEFIQGRNMCKFSNPRVKYENDKWILSIGIECEKQTLNLTNKKVGIDLGVKDLAVISFGNEMFKFNNINKTKKVIRLKKKMRYLQRKVSRKYEFNKEDNKFIKTNNIIKLEKQIKKIYGKLANIRNNHIHQATSKIIKLLPCKVVMEDLNVVGMMKNRHLSKAIGEQCFGEFIRQMKYKCEFYGIEFIQAHRFYPSSKTCSCCKNIKKDLKLKDRVYKCDKCGVTIDRDYNDSINLMNYSKA